MPSATMFRTIVYTPILNQQTPTSTLQADVAKVRHTASNITYTTVLLQMMILLTFDTFSIPRVVQAVINNLFTRYLY
jgi:hypothetical protein